MLMALLKTMRRNKVDSLRSQRPFAPRSIGTEEKELFESYRRQCIECGIIPRMLRHLELRAFLAENGIPEYDSRQVAEHMRSKARPLGKSWKWFPVRLNDYRGGGPVFTEFAAPDRFSSPSISYDEGGNGHEFYGHLIPEAIMNTMWKIASQFDDAVFYISDYAVPCPDPFLAVGIPGCPAIVVDFWNEPGFTPR